MTRIVQVTITGKGVRSPLPWQPGTAVAGPVAAWRCWRVCWPGVLYSCLDPNRYAVGWRDGQDWQRPAWCAFHKHFAPDNDPECGRCGWRGQPGLGQLTWWLADFKRVRPTVIGRVELGGTVLQGDYAHPEIPGILRAEHIRVTGPLVVAPGCEHYIGQLARRYATDVLPPSAAGRGRFWVRSVPQDLAGAGAR